jgi:hypothetical protein
MIDDWGERFLCVLASGREIGSGFRDRGQRCDACPLGPCTLGFCAKQTQFGSRQGEGQVVCGKGVMTEQTCKEHWKNKANSRPGSEWARAGAVDCAKQTQFGPGREGTDAGRASGGADHATSPQCPASGNKAKLGQDGASGGRCIRRGRFCKTKPIFRFRIADWARTRQDARSCETKPIPGEARWDEGCRANAQNEPNRPGCAGWDEARGAWDRGRIVRHRLDAPLRETKPMCPGSTGRGAARGPQVRRPAGARVRNKANCPKRGTEAVSGRGRREGSGIHPRVPATPFFRATPNYRLTLSDRIANLAGFSRSVVLAPGGSSSLQRRTFDRPRQRIPGLLRRMVA